MQDDDYKVQSYQDDLDDDNRPDPFMDEEAEDPAETEFGVPISDFKSELDKEIDDESEDLDSDDVDIEDDERNYIEDLDDSIDDNDY